DLRLPRALGGRRRGDARHLRRGAVMPLSRRDLLALSGGALAASTLRPSVARAQTPKPPDAGARRGGTLSLRTWDPPHFDPFQTISYTTHIALSFTRSSRYRYKAGPSGVPGRYVIERYPSQ